MSNVFSGVCTVVRDSEVKYLPSGQAVLNVTVANNQGFSDKQKSIFIRVALFGKRAEGKLQDYLKKGQQVFVSGELTQSEYQANDGTTKTSLELNANIIDLVGGKREGGQDQQSYQNSQPAAATNAAPERDNFDDYADDIPF
jgi:single-strand DNA-binding protein